MSIEQCGWTNFFDNSFREFRVMGLTPARVAREDKQRYLVVSEHGELGAEVTGKFRHQTRNRTDYPTVGDWVAIAARPAEGKASIDYLLPRQSLFCRKAVGSSTEEQPVAANIDFAFLTTGLDSNFSPRRIERYLTVCYDGGSSPIILLTKADMCPAVNDAIAEVEAVALGVPIHAISNVTGEGFDEVLQYFKPGVTCGIFGSSGVGKSTFINRLLGDDLLETKELRYDGRGVHTTTHRELIILPSGGIVIDTPGMKELGLWADEESLADAFEDIEALSLNCRFRDCTHTKEPGCAVIEAVEHGSLSAERLKAYFKLLREVAALARRDDRKLQAAEKARWKQIHMQMRQRLKFERQ